MKKIYFLFAAILSVGIFNAQDAGIYESYVILNIKNAGNTYYDLSANTPNPDFEGASLGTFSNTQTITFVGGEMKTFKNNGANVTGGDIYYRVYSNPPSGTFNNVPLVWMADLSNPGDQQWGSTAGTANILAGLNNGNYTIEVYVAAGTSVGTKYASNGGANYKATFTVNNNSLGVNDINSSAFKSFVEKGKLYTAKKGNVHIEILDFSGRVVKTFSAKPTNEGIELNLPKKGNYLLKIDNEVIKFVY